MATQICQILRLEEVSRADVELVGGKAASLGEMLQSGVMVPPGFVITTDGFKSGMLPDLKQTILDAFDTLGAERVAVRSSAVAEDSGSASWAGQLESYLNITRDTLIEAVQKCWHSIESEHAVAYAKEQDINEQAVAVVVQVMVDSELSGVLFTANPVTENQDEIVIEAAYGLGELLVQGMITPENIVAKKDSGKILRRQASKQKIMLTYKDGTNQEVPVRADLLEKLVVSEKQVKELGVLARKIEQHYGSPQDIEWAITDGKLYIVQSRPITTLGGVTKPSITFSKTFTREESLILCELVGHAFNEWLKNITTVPPPAQLVRIDRGLSETWLCDEATQLLIDDVHKNNLENPDYLTGMIERYKQLITKLNQHEERGAARTVAELKAYLALFRQAIVPLHVIFFTPLRPDTPKALRNLALKVRGEDSLFDDADLYIRDSLSKLYPEFNNIETFIGLDDLGKPDVNKIKQRENDFVWFEGQYLHRTLDTFRDKHPGYGFRIDEVDHDQHTIEGTVAYRGRVDGNAQLILRKKEVSDFQAGNVLVAPMTTPHYLPAMKKAVAFVTDEGGVTCHAAIVARELKTPCVIGTNIATEFLNNGDRVRVDANQGRITVLERA
jgi:pyruvate, water dikinase